MTRSQQNYDHLQRSRSFIDGQRPVLYFRRLPADARVVAYVDGLRSMNIENCLIIGMRIEIEPCHSQGVAGHWSATFSKSNLAVLARPEREVSTLGNVFSLALNILLLYSHRNRLQPKP